MSENDAGQHYSADQIEVLTGLQAVRKRAALYIGPLDSPTLPNDLLQETLCRSLVAGCKGQAKILSVELYANGRAVVRDDGPGWPMDFFKGEYKAETLLYALYACRDLNEEEMKGACNLGVVTVNALSSAFTFTNNVQSGEYEGKWITTYEGGVKKTPLTRVGPADGPGIVIDFTLDTTIVKATRFQTDAFAKKVMGVLPKGMVFRFMDFQDATAP